MGSSRFERTPDVKNIITEFKTMEQNKRKDPELVKVIDEAIASTTTHVAALDKVIEWVQKNRRKGECDGK